MLLSLAAISLIPVNKFIALGNLQGLRFEGDAVEARYQSDWIDPGFIWDELVPSWNLSLDPGVTFEVEFQVLTNEKISKAYHLGKWSRDDSRESVKDQKDELGDVLTDTLVVKEPGAAVRFVAKLKRPTADKAGEVKFFSIVLTDSKAKPAERESLKSVWGKTLDVPQRAQGSYPNGGVICSPTCVSMIMGYWAQRLGREELDPDVPDVCAAIYDKNWPGTGNWSFNTAYAGGFEGMRAYVSRLSDVRQLEAWIDAGVPIATSVAYDILRYGERRRGNDGHLIVLVGFDEKGDPVFNDPASSAQVRKTYPREMFIKAWAESNRTVYIIHPETTKPPKDELGEWVNP